MESQYASMFNGIIEFSQIKKNFFVNMLFVVPQYLNMRTAIVPLVFLHGRICSLIYFWYTNILAQKILLASLTQDKFLEVQLQQQKTKVSLSLPAQIVKPFQRATPVNIHISRIQEIPLYHAKMCWNLSLKNLCQIDGGK